MPSELLILDEPTTGIEPLSGDRYWMSRVAAIKSTSNRGATSGGTSQGLIR